MKENENDNPFYWRDEILQVLFWMTNEGFGVEFNSSDLQKFIAAEENVIQQNLIQMVDDGFVEQCGNSKYKLTTFGLTEGERCFADEFKDMVKPGHFECAEPDCDCHNPDFSGECKHLSPPSSVL